MSDALTDAQMLYIWERGIALGPTSRALLILGGARRAGQEACEWPVGRRDAALLEIRRATFGDRLASRTTCPRCGCELEFELDAGALRAHGTGPQGDQTIVLQQGGAHISVRTPTSSDLLAVETLGSSQAIETALWKRCVVAHDEHGAALDPEQLTAAQRDAVETALEDADCGMDLRIDLECRACATRWETAYDIARVLWLEIVQHARGVLHHVHQLARRYGWTERDVLSLGQRRREMYLALAE